MDTQQTHESQNDLRPQVVPRSCPGVRTLPTPGLLLPVNSVSSYSDPWLYHVKSPKSARRTTSARDEIRNRISAFKIHVCVYRLERVTCVGQLEMRVPTEVVKEILHLYGNYQQSHCCRVLEILRGSRTSVVLLLMGLPSRSYHRAF